MATIPEDEWDFFEKPTIAHFVTMMPDGRPHAAPVWIDYDTSTDRLVVNTERHRQKVRNVERNPAVAASMTEPDNPHRYLSVIGEVETVTTDGARDHIDALTQRYMGTEEYKLPIESERVRLVIRVDDVFTGF